MLTNITKNLNPLNIILVGILVIGVFLRIFGLGHSGIFFYDEALYLEHSLSGLEFLSRNHAAVAADPWKALAFYLQFPLNFTKPIWVMIIDSRYFFTHIYDWDFAKYAACFFGVLTLPLAYIFAKKYFGSTVIACLSAAILAVLPGHVFYSRVGLQEALSIFLVLAGFYFYLLPRTFGPRTFLAGLLFGMAYLSNYRLILLPGLLVVSELWLGLLDKQGMRWRHWAWTCVVFLAVMVLVGSFLGGAQMRYTFAWVFHQQDMSASLRGGVWRWVEVLAYPYYLFRLEHGFLALGFLGSVYFLIKRNWKFALLFVITIVQMLFFSFASDRGARYIAVVLPFVAMSCAALICTVFEDLKHPYRKFIIGLVVVVMLIGLTVRSFNLIVGVSAHRTAVQFLTDRDPGVKFLSSQPIVQKLYLKDRGRVHDIPVDFKVFCRYHAQGFRYLLLDPQAYIAFGADDHKWSLPLKGYLGFIDQRVRPVKTFSHFNRAVMERVVFEHSDDLVRSIRFLDSKDLIKMSMLRIYDISTLIPEMMLFVQQGKYQK